jgi:hypothetical protein
VTPIARGIVVRIIAYLPQNFSKKLKPREVSDDSAPHACGRFGRLRIWMAEE